MQDARTGYELLAVINPTSHISSDIFFYQIFINRLGDSADLFVDDFPVLEKDNGWDIPDFVFHCNLRILINVYFAGYDTAIIFISQFMDDR